MIALSLWRVHEFAEDWQAWPGDYNDTYFVVVLSSYIELTEGGEYT